MQPLYVCTLKYIRNDGLRIAGHTSTFLYNVACKKQTVPGPMWQAAVYHEVAGGPA
jgi:hypothetical protein